MARSGWDLKAAMAYAVAASSLGALAPAHSAVGIALLPLALVVPGYAIARAIEGPRGFDAIELGVLTVIFSFATAVVGGLYLNGLPGGLQEHSWSTLFLIVTVVAGCVALLRRTAGAAIATPIGRLTISRRGAVMLVLASVLVVAAAVIAVRSQSRLDAKPVTQLSAGVRRDGKGVADAAVTTTNKSQRPDSYRLVVRRRGRMSVIVRVHLAAGGRRTLSYIFDPADGGLVASLESPRSRAPFRQVTVK